MSSILANTLSLPGLPASMVPSVTRQRLGADKFFVGLVRKQKRGQRMIRCPRAWGNAVLAG
jgi:hypothetical protein